MIPATSSAIRWAFSAGVSVHTEESVLSSRVLRENVVGRFLRGSTSHPDQWVSSSLGKEAGEDRRKGDVPEASGPEEGGTSIHSSLSSFFGLLASCTLSISLHKQETEEELTSRSFAQRASRSRNAWTADRSSTTPLGTGFGPITSSSLSSSSAAVARDGNAGPEGNAAGGGRAGPAWRAAARWGGRPGP